MHQIAFQSNFFFPIKFEFKRQSIQPLSSIKAGDELLLTTDSKNPKLIRTAKTISVSPIQISLRNDVFRIILKGEQLTFAKIGLLALAEGFNRTEDFIAFCVLKHLEQPNKPFFGNLIKWECFPEEDELGAAS